MTDFLSTDPYKGVRDFYPHDMAIQRYIFETWSKTAESFGFERYDASVLEPASLYKAKGAENAEMVNEQTYTFTDRGDREVTLRPEMTPTVARMIAAKQRELAFPVRWYSIPNLFRYERMQRGRLREHWQLNCDLFGSNAVAADVELIALAYQTLTAFGATPEQFQIKLNHRGVLEDFVKPRLKNPADFSAYLRLLDRSAKISKEAFESEVNMLLKDGDHGALEPDERIEVILGGLRELGIENVVFDATITRGFNYYTGMVFEIFDTSAANNRSLLGGGRYDNLTEMFGSDAVAGVGFGMGDVTMRDFLETHNLLPTSMTSFSAPHVVIIPVEKEYHIFAEKIAMAIRGGNYSALVDLSNKKLGEKITRASERGGKFVVVVGEDEVASGQITIKNLRTKEEQCGEPGAVMHFLAIE